MPRPNHVHATPRAAATAVALAATLVVVGCSAEAESPPATAGGTTGPSTTASSSATASSQPTTVVTGGPTSGDATTTAAAAGWPPFTSSVSPVSTERLATTWRDGCPVGPDSLRLVTVTHATFDGTSATGELVVNTAVVDDVVAAFADLYAARFPVRSMITMDAFGGDDRASGEADNTSGFNCRNVLGTDRWSQHSYGYAIDINPVENPYVVPDEILPPAGAAYLDRADVRPGMIVEGDVVFQAFTSRGFEWGGFFVTTPDFQHFALPR